MMTTCETCKFFTGLQCRRYPPTLVPVASGIQSPARNPIYIPESWWPHVAKTEWCGEHQQI